MADRNSLRQQAPKFCDVGSGVKLYELPLLPYEKQLIETIGWSEEDYRRFAYLARKHGAVRPAEYAHIPDIQNSEPFTTALIVSLVVGALSTAASFLLAPKPASLPDNNVRRRRTAGREGQQRFSPTVGFDTQADVADYASPIPIVFGKYTGSTGGVVVSPQLVWSRSFSLGTQQAVKQLFVVGEQGLGEGLDRPELNGIFLGNTPLDAAYAHSFAFYWKRNTNNFFRITARNFAYGSRGNLSSGDIENNNDIFLCPTGRGLADTGFSASYSQSANTQFGVYNAIPNGTNYRVNWKIVSIPKLEGQEDDPGNRLTTERIKISGDYGILKTEEGFNKKIRAQGQRGVGRNYGRRMGIVSLNGVPVSDNGTTPTAVREAAVGDTAVFAIAPGAIPKDLYHLGNESTSVDDINSAISSSRRVADDLLQVGETIMIGRTVWVVRDRSIPIWDEGRRQNITLECVELFGTGISNQIGLISERMLARGVYNDDNGTTNARDGLNMVAGAGFYPLLRVNFGVVRNTRACDVTEIGIRSQVWNRANGLCNFAALPSPKELNKADKDQISFETGQMNLYLKRTSIWTIFLRPAGTDENGVEFEWRPLGEQFCVTGESPQDQFNYIRLGHPERRQYEFKFLPKSGADVARHSPATAQFIRLSAKTNQTVGGRFETAYGPFQVSAAGEYVTVGDITYNPEMATNPVITTGTTETTIPDAIEVETYLPDVEGGGATATAVGFFDWLPDGVSVGRRGATHYELFGQASSFGLRKTATRTANLGDGRSITIQFNGIVDSFYPANHPFFPGFRAWRFESINVVSSTGGFNTQQIFNVSIPVSGFNPRAQPYGLTSVGVRLIVLATSAGPVVGRESAWEYELLGDQEAYAIGAQRTVSFTVTASSGGTATIDATGTVTARPSTSPQFPGVTKAWDVNYSVDPLNTSGNFVAGALMENGAVVSASNPFMTSGSTVGIVLRTLSLTTTQVPPGFNGDRVFEFNSQINDLSLYDGLLTKSNESSPEHSITYVNESVVNPTVPNYEKLTLCGLALKSSRNYANLDQLRMWLADGIPVKRFLASESGSVGPSNKFVDLVYHLLTDTTAGAGNIVSAEMIRTEDFAATAQFLQANKLFFDGALDQPTNIRQFISDTAPFFLCNFVISDGKFSLVPALPTDESGQISNQPVPIQQLFTAGNIIDGSYSVEYLSSEERKDFQAVMRYREERRNQLPEEKTLVVRYAEAGSDVYPIESFDMTQYCTSRDHAFLVAKYFLSLRRRVTHTVRFRTSPFGISLKPGSFIRVVTEASPYQSANNGTISADGTIVSATELEDGTYSIVYFGVADDEVTPATMTIAGGKVVESALYDKLFTISDATVSSNVYMVEQLTLGEDGMVDVVATEFPATSGYNSLISLDVLTDAAFTTEG